MHYDKTEIPTTYDKARALAPETRRLWQDLHWLEPALMDPASGLMIFAFHSTVIKTPRATILVDTCSVDQGRSIE